MENPHERRQRMKRFTETNKWRDTWFRKLSGTAKFLLIYLFDNCDAVGLIEIDLKLVSDDIGFRVEEKHLAELGDRVQALEGNRFFLPKFISFQYGELTPLCPPHRSILKLVQQHGLEKQGLLYSYPKARVTGNQDYPSLRAQGKDKEEEKDKEQEKEKDDGFPEILNTPEFRVEWAKWETHRKEIRKKITPTARNEQLGKLAEMGVLRAISALQHSIASGWQGVFEPYANQSNRGSGGNRPRLTVAEERNSHIIGAAETLEQIRERSKANETAEPPF